MGRSQNLQGGGGFINTNLALISLSLSLSLHCCAFLYRCDPNFPLGCPWTCSPWYRWKMPLPLICMSADDDAWVHRTIWSGAGIETASSRRRANCDRNWRKLFATLGIRRQEWNPGQCMILQRLGVSSNFWWCMFDSFSDLWAAATSSSDQSMAIHGSHVPPLWVPNIKGACLRVGPRHRESTASEGIPAEASTKT